jgi:hypothetical protein
LNAHRATLGASMMLLEQQKTAPNWAQVQQFMLMLLPSILNAHEADLNTHRAPFKRI